MFNECNYAKRQSPKPAANQQSQPATPHNPALCIICGAREDAELRALVGGVLNPLDASLDIEVERFDRAGETVGIGGEGADGSHLSSP